MHDTFKCAHFLQTHSRRPSQKTPPVLLHNWLNSQNILGVNVPSDELFSSVALRAHSVDFYRHTDSLDCQTFQHYGLDSIPDLHVVKFGICTCLCSPVPGVYRWTVMAVAEAEKADGTPTYVDNDLTEPDDEEDAILVVKLSASISLGQSTPVHPLTIRQGVFIWDVMVEYLKFAIKRAKSMNLTTRALRIPGLITDIRRVKGRHPSMDSVTLTISTVNDGMNWSSLALLEAHDDESIPAMTYQNGDWVWLRAEVYAVRTGASVFRELFDWECVVEYLKRESFAKWCGFSVSQPLRHFGLLGDGRRMFRAPQYTTILWEYYGGYSL
ncbi:hypothetical protein DL98DRAFT_592751 [Cadophora sp. DSE1049]|nr:hypothetical protein DL98DRAFT_592751 [Cadophora sp. DSE1049]